MAASVSFASLVDYILGIIFCGFQYLIIGLKFGWRREDFV